jgi:hypothetical protein
MSSLAVFLVLGGATAFAATQLAKNSVGSKQIKKNAVTNAKIKNKAVSGAKIADGAVATSKIGSDAVTGDKVNESTLGQVPTANFANGAGSAQPEVFAKIEGGSGSVVPSLSKGLTDANVTHPSAGTYCITVPAFEARGAVANTQFGGTYGAVAQVTVGGTGFCPAPAVQVITSSGGAPNNFTFYVVLYH